MRKIPLVLAGVAAAVTPVVLAAPGPEPAMSDGPAGRPVRTVDDAVAACRASGKAGWELVDEATQLVHRMSRPGNTAGNVAFVPVTEVLDRTRLNSIDTALALAPIVVASVWKSWLTGSGIQSWMYRPFGLSA